LWGAARACSLHALTDGRSPDQLWTTLVVDQQQRALGVVYSNLESLAEAMKQCQGIYWSRKRGLWPKGATSGDTQTVHHVGFDCDRDLLIFTVTQHGKVSWFPVRRRRAGSPCACRQGFCHRGIYSCGAEASGVTALERTLWDRKANAPKGSYTERLYSDDGLLRNKLIEEAIELSEVGVPHASM
jgi:phosphoribosyl-ATP pyrophosphohydrolase/phosphoribosyl-AMP cyclohydrolase/histidinol dehydrogenase